jgi:hypothetical protein
LTLRYILYIYIKACKRSLFVALKFVYQVTEGILIKMSISDVMLGVTIPSVQNSYIFSRDVFTNKQSSLSTKAHIAAVYRCSDTHVWYLGAHLLRTMIMMKPCNASPAFKGENHLPIIYIKCSYSDDANSKCSYFDIG